jgi:hypothetical protein
LDEEELQNHHDALKLIEKDIWNGESDWEREC